jgi:DNA-binding CsgD family transcriptional regulator
LTGPRPSLKVIEDPTNVELLPVSAAVLDATGKIIGVNQAWKDFGRRNGLCLQNYGVGANYLTHCGSRGRGQAIEEDLRELLVGKRDLVMRVYPCDSPRKKRWFMMLALPLSLTRKNGIAILHTEITSLVPRSELSTSALREPSTSAFAQTVVHSASQALALQLQAMIGLEEPKRSPSKPRQTEQKAQSRVLGTGLSKRQLEVLRLIGEGKTNAEIARTLFRSTHTIKLHVSAILRALKVTSRTQAALIASELFDKPSAGDF